MGKLNTIKIGDVFGRLTVIDTADPYIDPKSNKRRARYLCECGCDNHTQKIVSCSDLSSGRVKSCGCLLKDSASNTGKSNTTHGLSKTKVLQSYYNMCKKCTDDNIPMEDSWKQENGGALNFYNDMESTYMEGLRLTRLDPSIGYFKFNCIWSSHIGNYGHMISNENSRYTISEWTKILGHSKNKIYDRLKNGWSDHDALFGKPESKDIINGVYFIDNYGNPINMDTYIDNYLKN